MIGQTQYEFLNRGPASGRLVSAEGFPKFAPASTLLDGASKDAHLKSDEPVQNQLRGEASPEAKRRAVFKTRGLTSSCNTIYSGARFRGEQRSGRNSYGVEVEIKSMDLETSFMCGYLHIKGLTEDYPQLTTFFEAEIIGPKHSFLTRKWDADEAVDRQHWSKFPAFAPFEHCFNDDTFAYDSMNADYIFMRWKEHFLVPDHHIRSIAGASFAGFYYICVQRSTGHIMGYYYHQNSEWFQSLELQQVSNRTFGSYDFA
eukprot:Clim_evm13s134 gene=Clim_evmTU13s134